MTRYQVDSEAVAAATARAQAAMSRIQGEVAGLHAQLALELLDRVDGLGVFLRLVGLSVVGLSLVGLDVDFRDLFGLGVFGVSHLIRHLLLGKELVVGTS
jgi:hypothetical protein